MKGIRDIDGHDLKDGDKILLTDWIAEISEPLYIEGTVIEKEDGFYLGKRKLELLDIFRILNYGEYGEEDI